MLISTVCVRYRGTTLLFLFFGDVKKNVQPLLKKKKKKKHAGCRFLVYLLTPIDTITGVRWRPGPWNAAEASAESLSTFNNNNDDDDTFCVVRWRLRGQSQPRSAACPHVQLVVRLTHLAPVAGELSTLFAGVVNPADVCDSVHVTLERGFVGLMNVRLPTREGELGSAERCLLHGASAWVSHCSMHRYGLHSKKHHTCTIF